MGGRGASGKGHISATGKTNYGVAMKRQGVTAERLHTTEKNIVK